MASVSAQVFCDLFIGRNVDVFGIWCNSLKRSLAPSNAHVQCVRKDSAVRRHHSSLYRSSMVLFARKMSKMWSQIRDETVDIRFERNRLSM
jgi:hypothetical protein